MLACVSAQLPFDARCLRSADRRATEADASCASEHNHETRECLHDGKAEGTRRRGADVFFLHSAKEKSLRLNWLRGLDLNQRPLGYEGSHELILRDLVRRG